MAISETKIKANTPLQYLRLPGYEFLHVDSPTKFGGVGIYYKDTIFPKVRQDLNLNCEGAEDMWIELEINGKTNVIGVIYRHPTHNYNKKFNNSLNAMWKHWRIQIVHIVFVEI